MKSIMSIDIHSIYFDDEIGNIHDTVQDDTVWLALENEEGLSWDDVMEQQEESDVILPSPYYEFLQSEENEPFPEFSSAYACFQAQQKISQIDALMETFEKPIIASEMNEYWIDGYTITQKIITNIH
ncbi:hypothetical protein C8D76_105128 [Pasteurella langaaensis DSM 22999]|uniref:Uncharacterized protein n=2 Tax=Alitibacter langaaensis TaxID=756 RepID=A0A2U0T850_9PAST|nr:hypothetical protein C8D76_105128 [Pasteurella langaaensis DSM 22999]